tara:strand:- start:15 stop:470 length:456 start_codon:yes stop_codon:yes gene_type:complete
MPPKKKSPKEHGNTKFDESLRSDYLRYLRNGNLKYESARLCGISYETVEYRRRDDQDFKDAEVRAMSEAREGVEAVLHDMARQGDISAIKMWLTAHDRSTYGEKKQIELDATPAALELGMVDAYARIAELQTELAKRSERLQLDDSHIIDI